MTPRAALMQPRSADALRGVLATRLAARTFSQLPAGYWQRRVAARAFGLSVVPPIDRHRPQTSSFWTLGGASPIFVVETPVALWGFVSRPGPDAVDVLDRLRALGRRDFTAVLTVTADAAHDEDSAGRGPRPAVIPSRALQIATLSIRDLIAVFRDAAVELPRPQQTVATLAARALQQIDDTREAIDQDLHA
jgi:hypothetical protein